MPRLPTHRNVIAAQRRLDRRVHRTPLLGSRSLSELAGVQVLFKCENLQRSGSFKFRGALNAVLSLSAAERRRGVVTHSSGNHGSALACVAQGMGLAATVVVPRSASAFKRAAIRRYGARIVDCGASLGAREKTLARVVADSGASYIPPYDHAAVIAGQGTASLEILADAETAEEIWVPVGGGGLAAGSILGAADHAQIVGAEPALADDAARSLRLGVRQSALPPMTVADGLRTALGELNFGILHNYSLPIHLVSEAEILAAQKLAMSCLKIVLEPSSAVPVAALLKYGPWRAETRCVVVSVTGGNIELEV